MEKEETMEYLK